jgi:hypothetical protein
MGTKFHWECLPKKPSFVSKVQLKLKMIDKVSKWRVLGSKNQALFQKFAPTQK